MKHVNLSIHNYFLCLIQDKSLNISNMTQKYISLKSNCTKRTSCQVQPLSSNKIFTAGDIMSPSFLNSKIFVHHDEKNDHSRYQASPASYNDICQLVQNVEHMSEAIKHQLNEIQTTFFAKTSQSLHI